VRPDDLAARVITDLLERNPGLREAPIDDVAFGAANQSGEDNRNVARMALLLAGLPVSVPGTTLNRLCGSSLDALLYGFRSIALGESDTMIVGGVESMSRAPFVMAKPEAAFPRALDLVDTTLGWRLVNEKMPREWTISMGETAEEVAKRCNISRHAQDEFSLVSHERAVAAIDGGLFSDEITGVSTKSGDVLVDEGPRRDTTLKSLASLRPVFRTGGSVTAGNSSTLNDGACALVLASEERASELGITPIARICGGSVAGVSPEVMGLGPVPATNRLLGRLELDLGSISAIELNEAFAAQSLGVLGELGLRSDDVRVNARGGAIALGHPLGASGARITTTLIHRLRSEGGGLGLATMCVGVGQGIALVVEV
jgi:acetyl-CoA acetyltransferase family protein